MGVKFAVLPILMALSVSAASMAAPTPPNWQPGYKGWQTTRPGQPGQPPQRPLERWQHMRQWQDNQGWKQQVEGLRDRQQRVPGQARISPSVGLDTSTLAPLKSPDEPILPEGAIQHSHPAGDYISKDGVCYRRSWMTTDHVPIPCP